MTEDNRIIRRTLDFAMRQFDVQRVAIYARVSRESEMKHHSIVAQKEHLKEFVDQHLDWEFVDFYIDEGVTGTRLDRPELNRLLQDVKAGKIDIILTKSVSRLGRNTAAVLKMLQDLKQRGVFVVFDNENVSTADPEGMFYLQTLCIMAEAESKQTSDYQKWAIRNRFKLGIPTYFRIYGYEMIDRQLYVVPEEAEVVKRIFKMYLDGMGRERIARQLISEGVPGPLGNKWRCTSVYRILCNERYTGDLLMQKWVRYDHLTKRDKRNKGEFPQYLVPNAHEAIIEKETFERVQQEIARRARVAEKTIAEARATDKGNPKANQPRLFTQLIYCANCGGVYMYRFINMKGYTREIWVCRNYYRRGKAYCKTKAIPENILVQVTEEVLLEQKLIKAPSLTGELIRKNIQKIIAYPDQTLEYHLRNGEIVTKKWQFKSRSEAWTPEMKQKAREKTLARSLDRKEDTDE